MRAPWPLQISSRSKAAAEVFRKRGGRVEDEIEREDESSGGDELDADLLERQ